MFRGGRHDTSTTASFLLSTSPVGSAKLVPASDTLMSVGTRIGLRRDGTEGILAFSFLPNVPLGVQK